MTNALDDFTRLLKIGTREIFNFRFADDIDLNAENKELDELTKRLDKAASNMGMTISIIKSTSSHKRSDKTA